MSHEKPTRRTPKWRVAFARRIAGIYRDEISTIDTATVRWIRGAERHLAALQESYDALRVQFEELTRTHANVLEWIRLAERHLSALQAEQLRTDDGQRAQFAAVLGWI